MLGLAEDTRSGSGSDAQAGSGTRAPLTSAIARNTRVAPLASTPSQHRGLRR